MSAHEIEAPEKAHSSRAVESIRGGHERISRPSLTYSNSQQQDTYIYDIFADKSYEQAQRSNDSRINQSASLTMPSQQQMDSVIVEGPQQVTQEQRNKGLNQPTGKYPTRSQLSDVWANQVWRGGPSSEDIQQP